jgi:serine/threonine-protein kinase
MTQPADPNETIDEAPGMARLRALASAPAAPVRLELLEEIARGGVGAVLKGRDMDLGRDVAVKVLLANHVDKADLAQRFLDEACIAGRLQHPGVVPVYALGRLADGRPFFTMKLVKGRTLAQLLAECRDPAAERPRFLHVFEQICQAVAYAHARGVIHRDLKPSNVMVGAYGEVQVMDWGMAKVLQRDGTTDEPGQEGRPTEGASVIQTPRGGAAGRGSETLTGSVLGTPAYMAPEQARGEVEDVDRRADVFGLGGILCEILTGRPPYPGASEEALKRARRADLADARARLDASGADGDVVALAKRCLAAEPAGRPRDAGETAAAVTAYRESVERRLRLADAARAEARAKAVEERKRRRLMAALAGSLLLTALAVGGGWLWVTRDRAARREEAEQAAGRALGRAEELAEQAKAIEPDTPQAAGQAVALWAQARDVVMDAERALAAGPETDEARGRLAARRESIEGGLKRAEKEDRLLKDLDQARGLRADSRPSRHDTETAARSYAKALGDYGLNVSGAEAAAAVLAERPAVRLAIIVSLDDWADCVGGDEATRLHRIADAADGDDWRRRYRAAAAGSLEDLKQLAQEARNLELPAVSADLLAAALIRHEARAEAAALLRQARSRRPADFWVHFELGVCMDDEDHPDAVTLQEAVGSDWAALALRPDSAPAHNNLGNALYTLKDLDGAIACYNKAIALSPEYVKVYYNRGNAFCAKGDLDDAVASYTKAIELDPGYAHAHNNLGLALAGKGDLDGAIAHYRKAVELDPGYAHAHNNLGIALKDKGDLDGAITCYHKAIELDPKHWEARLNLGIALAAQDDLEGAAAAFTEGIKLNPNEAQAHFRLGETLRLQGKFAEARDSARRCLALLAPDAPLRPAATAALERCQRLLALESKLGPVLRGEQQPADASERLGLIAVCKLQRRYAAAARLYRDGFAADVALTDDPTGASRYNAACYAALAGSGQGEDAKDLDDKACADWRKQALDWLRADLDLWAKKLEGDRPEDRQAVKEQMQHWQQDADLAGVRDAAQLAKLPADEQAACRKLWADVQALLDTAAAKE